MNVQIEGKDTVPAGATRAPEQKRRLRRIKRGTEGEGLAPNLEPDEAKPNAGGTPG